MMDDYIAGWGGDISDRGKAKHFRGRKQVLANVRKRLRKAEIDPAEGTTFLIQGAPGAGKSALLHECARLAEGEGWKVAEITLDALWNVPTLLDALGRSKEFDQKGGRWSGGLKAGLDLLSSVTAKVGVNYKSKKTPVPHNTRAVLKSGEGKLLLVLDEAQMLAKRTPRRHAPQVTILINAIHNGKLGYPVMLAVGGLATTRQAFRDMDVSRFKTHCYVELGPLKPKWEREIITNWIMTEGEAKRDPLPWIDAIAAQTHGWPQHIAFYAQAAALQVRADRKEMTLEGLNVVLDTGRREQVHFYESRADGLAGEDRAAIAREFEQPLDDCTQTRTAIMESLTKAVGEGNADAVLRKALSQGVLDWRGDRLVIPIPSMQDWFIENYCPDQAPYSGRSKPPAPSDAGHP